KIVIAHNWNETSFNTQSVKLAEALSQQNQVLFISQMRLPCSPLQINPNLKVVQWPSNRPKSIKDILFCHKLLRAFKPDITISHFTAQTIMSFVGKFLGIKNRISWYHTLLEQLKLDFKGNSFQFYLQRARRKMILQLTTNIVLVSNYSITEVAAAYKIPEAKLKVIHNGVVDHPFRNTNSNQPNFIFLGRYDECKGIDIFIKAIAIVKKEIPTAKFIFAGGKLNQKFTQLIKDGKSDNVIENVGYIEYNKVANYLCSGYALVVPSRIDNLPTVILEAFSCGTPVIGSRSGGIPEMVQDGYNGLLFEKENPASLAKKIVELANNPDKRMAMALNARKTFESGFTIENYVNNVIHFLDGLK
ncbi:MAG: glycosyltransferase family 4 protein, partial [Chitinophagaceae bacterium]|nr:glycosyltransferase family 4 protein [Chitinophagaceae bacterium]